jgi:hypothetical protein
MPTPAPRIGKYAAGRKNRRPKNSERQPANAAFHVASELAKPARKPLRQKVQAVSPGLINR